MKITISGKKINSYTHVSLQHQNETDKKPWPIDCDVEADKVMLLSVVENGDIICEVDYLGNIAIANHRSPFDVIRLIALILSYQKSKQGEKQ